MARVSAQELEKELSEKRTATYVGEKKDRATFRFPKVGEEVLLRHEARAGIIRPRQAIQEVSRIVAVYMDKRVKVSSGDVWTVEPHDNSTAQWRTTEDA